MHKQKIRIILRAYDKALVAQAGKEIVSTVKRVGSGAVVCGPVPLPTGIERFTVNRSPHIDKKSREAFEIRTHKRLVVIEDPKPETIEALGKVDLPAGVDVQIKVVGDSQ